MSNEHSTECDNPETLCDDCISTAAEDGEG
jgi:hypothetical protein